MTELFICYYKSIYNSGEITTSNTTVCEYIGKLKLNGSKQLEWQIIYRPRPEECQLRIIMCRISYVIPNMIQKLATTLRLAYYYLLVNGYVATVIR